MHVAQGELSGRSETGYGKVCAVNVDRVVLRAGETTVIDDDTPLATGKLYEVGKTGTGTPAAGLGLHGKVAESQVLGHLTDDAEVAEEGQVEVLQHNVPAVLDQSAHFVTYAVAHLEHLPRLGVRTLTVVETHRARPPSRRRDEQWQGGSMSAR